MGEYPPPFNEQMQTHVHEFLGSTMLAQYHTHRFAGVTGQVIPAGDGRHIHELMSNTDFTDHFHRMRVRTGPNIEVGYHKHVHFVYGVTTFDSGHEHEFIFAVLIENPYSIKKAAY